MNKNHAQAINALYCAISSLYVQTYPHARTTPAGEDPYSFDIVHEDNQDIIRSKCGFVEAHVEDLGEAHGLRSRFRCVIVTCYDDDVAWTEFPNETLAARHYLTEQFRMNISTRSPISGKFPPLWPKVKKVFRRNELDMPPVSASEFIAA
jgi:hypothetical protein